MGLGTLEVRSHEFDDNIRGRADGPLGHRAIGGVAGATRGEATRLTADA